MFKKQYKIKTNNTIKGSDRRKLRAQVEASFSNLSADDINSLLPNKGEMTQVKGMLDSGSVVTIYCSSCNPLFFQISKGMDFCFPTVYTLWKYPNILPIVTTIPPVIEKICNGADLMAPGVVVSEATLLEMEHLEVKGMCAVRILGNKYPIAVGIALMSKEELMVDGVKGKAVNIVHTYQDTLFISGDQQEMPFAEENDMHQITEYIQEINISEPTETKEEEVADLIEPSANSNMELDDPSEIEDHLEDKNSSIPDYTMDEVLLCSFLTSVKVFGKKIDLPILTSTFYSSHVLKSCPLELSLDIKKTSYKKLSVFLKKMQKEGVLQIKELTKGVESIVSLNLENDFVTKFCIDPLFKKHIAEEKERYVEPQPSANIQSNYRFPIVTELYVISAHVKSFFERFQMKKGDTISGVTIKNVLKQYVKDNNLQSQSNPRDVILDPILADCTLKKGRNDTSMKWEELYELMTSKMTHAYQIEFENKTPIVKKGKLEPINITIETRTGNKKVTLVHNLDIYGIHPEKFAQHVQVAVAASTSILPTQNGKGIQVLIQGNQVRYLQKLFLETYKVPRKYLQGLDNIPKKK